MLRQSQRQLGMGLVFVPHFNKVTLSRQPIMHRKSIVPIYPPPGLKLEIPEWTADKFLKRIGNGASDYSDKFETLNELFDLDVHGFKAKGIPAKVRKYLLRTREELRRGVLTFDYLERRTIDNVKLKPKPKK